MKKYFLNVLFMTVAIILGVFAANILPSDDAYARSGCDKTGCQWDYFGGFRCFSSDHNYICDDSSYPDCSDTICGGGDPGTPPEPILQSQ